VRNSGGHYENLPFAFLNLVVLMISVVLDFNPFSAVSLWLFAIGTLFNQVLRMHGALSTIRDSGLFYGLARVMAYFSGSDDLCSSPGHGSPGIS